MGPVATARCAKAGTPECKVHDWQEALRALRKIALDSGLAEERKWGVSCYTAANKNILLIGAFKDNCVMTFFRGSLLKDPARILELPGKNSQAGRVVRFTDAKQIQARANVLKKYIKEAVKIAEAG